ncbi:MAG TPA: hypothetical protein VJV23_08105 [Candidatus Polarisedimenticolia bacterium]|nr:hypothetical protein [Candidatus Polarisedimenticolia bacterium]
MKSATIAAGAFAAVLGLLSLAAAHRALEQHTGGAVASPAPTPSTAAEAHQAFLYGRISTDDGQVYEGRLRWGGNEEAFWGDYFNGFKDENPWASHVPAERLPTERRRVEFFGFEIARREHPIPLGRPFMGRFGDIARIEARGTPAQRLFFQAGDVRVTLKSGTVFDLDRLSANDFDDGVRVWDAERGVVDLSSRRILAIEFLSAARPGAGPHRLHGTVRTAQGDFTGFVQWRRQECIGTDLLDGRTAGGTPSRLRFDTIRSIARRSPSGLVVTLLDGREILLSGTGDTGEGHRGIYVDDRRYGRVLVSWEAFQRVDFTPGGSGPGYDDFPPGRPLTGSVTTRGGRRLAGRLVYDLDESETTETFDAPSQGVDFTIPFGLVASVVLPGSEPRGSGHARVTLHHGGELQLELAGDLGEGNAGMLIFAEGLPRPEHVPWADVEQVRFDRPPAIHPPLDDLP